MYRFRIQTCSAQNFTKIPVHSRQLIIIYWGGNEFCVHCLIPYLAVRGVFKTKLTNFLLFGNSEKLSV